MTEYRRIRYYGETILGHNTLSWRRPFLTTEENFISLDTEIKVSEVPKVPSNFMENSNVIFK